MTRGRTRSAAMPDRGAVAGLVGQLAELETLTVAQLREKYEEVYGERSRSRNKDYLRKKVAWRIQELAEGGLSDRALARIDELADDVPIRWRAQRGAVDDATTTAAAAAAATPPTARDPRLPPAGTVLTRSFNGVEHQVTVLADGFEYQGQRYTSLSKLAREITGTNWNGFLFWGLQSRQRGGRKERA